MGALLRAGRGLGIACSLPSHGGRSETRGLGLPVASALSATAAPVLRYARVGIASVQGNGLASCEDRGLILSTQMWFLGVDLSIFCAS